MRQALSLLLFFTLFTVTSYAAEKRYQWEVSYGPFSESEIRLTAIGLGWVQDSVSGVRQEDGSVSAPELKVNENGDAVNNQGKTIIDFVTDYMIAQQASILAQVKIRNELQLISNQQNESVQRITNEAKGLINSVVNEME
jgi:hypothetical protein